jgi:radical SAM protein with 4Fe4S-binding SPASM domain
VLRHLKKRFDLLYWAASKGYLRRNPQLTYLFWECTLNCNFYCQHCGSNAGKKVFKDELTSKEIKNVLNDVAKNFDAKRITLAVTGGEPLLRSDLFEVMTYANELGFNWGMVTNGFLVTPEVVSKMKKAGMKTVVVSIDALGEKHDEFRGMLGAYDRAIKAVQLMAGAKFLSDVQITTSVHKGNLGDLEAMYKEFSKLDITSWRVMNVDPIGRAESNQDLLLNGKELKQLLDFIKAKRKNSKFRVTYGCCGFLGLDYEKEVRSHYFYCNTGINTASILNNGDIFVCPNVPRRKELIQGNVKKDRFSQVWSEKFKLFRQKERTSNNECLNCDNWEECLGGSFHLWDLSEGKTKFCHFKELNR